MTLGLALGAFKIPVLVSDALVSGAEAPIPLNIPTIGDVTSVFPEGSGFVPIALCSKLEIVQGSFAFVWSGPVVAAREFVSEVRSLSARDRLTRSNLERIAQNLAATEIGRRLQIIGFLDEGGPDIPFVTLGRPRSIPVSTASGLHSISAIGSGATYARLASELQYVADAFKPPRRPYSTGPAAAQIASALLHCELEEGSTLLSYFGGAYDIAIHTNEGFVRVAPWTYCLWYGSADDGGARVEQLRAIFAFARRADTSLVRRVILAPVAGGQPACESDTVHAYASACAERPDVAGTDRPELNAPIVAHVVALRSSTGVFWFSAVSSASAAGVAAHPSLRASLKYEGFPIEPWTYLQEKANELWTARPRRAPG